MRADDWRAFYRGSREEVAARAFAALKSLLVHARDTVPFHAQRMAAVGLVPERMTSPADLARLPPLTGPTWRRTPALSLRKGRASPTS